MAVADVDGDALLTIVRRMDKIRDEFIAELFEIMRTQIKGLNYDARMIELWRASVTENFVAAVHYLARDEPTSLLEAPAAALAYARAAAQRDIALAPLVRAHRLGHAHFVEVAMQYVSELPPEQQVPTMVELVTRSARVIDMVADQLIVAYEQEHDRWLSRRSGLQQRWISEVLAGKPIDVARAEKVLRYPLNGTHIAAVVCVDAAVPTADAVTIVDQVRSILAAELSHVGNTLLVLVDEREVRLWFSLAHVKHRDKATPDNARLRSAVDSAGLRARVAFGRVESGLRGFRVSLEQAERAKAVILAGERRRPGRVVFYGDVAPIALMAADVEELRRFVTEVLGGLSVDDERNEWLRETLREFLARNRSYVATADAMTLHRNTIQYRVTQAMDLCGQSFDDPDAVFRVQTALEICRAMAPEVLRAAKPTT